MFYGAGEARRACSWTPLMPKYPPGQPEPHGCSYPLSPRIVSHAAPVSQARQRLFSQLSV